MKKGFPRSIETKQKISESLIGHGVSEESRQKMSESHKGFKHTEESKLKIGLASLGKKRSEEIKKRISKTEQGKIVSAETRLKIGKANLGKKLSIETREKLSKLFGGEKGSNWQGGIAKINKLIKGGLEYRLWREKVFERDNYTCQDCKIKSGVGKTVYLHPHHIKSFSKYPNLRFEVLNGITLCSDCHKLTENYGANIKKEINFG